MLRGKIVSTTRNDLSILNGSAKKPQNFCSLILRFGVFSKYSPTIVNRKPEWLTTSSRSLSEWIRRASNIFLIFEETLAEVVKNIFSLNLIFFVIELGLKTDFILQLEWFAHYSTVLSSLAESRIRCKTAVTRPSRF